MIRVKLEIILLIVSFLNLSAQDFSITIDGEKDNWYNGLTGPEDGLIYLSPNCYLRQGGLSSPDNKEDISVLVWFAWDNEYLYIYEDVKDDTVLVNNPTYYQNDGLWISIDPQPNKDDLYGALNCHLTALDEDKAQEPIGVANLIHQRFFQDTNENIWEPTENDYARKVNPDGYSLECRIPLAYVNYLPDDRYLQVGEGEQFGFAFNQVDNDNVSRDTQLQWSAGHDDATWNNTQLLGTGSFLSDHKLKFEAVNTIDPTVINDSASVWYYPTAQDFLIVIDAQKDSWYENLSNPDDGLVYLPARSYIFAAPDAPDNEEDFSAMVWMAWDSTYLYIYEEVNDEIVLTNQESAWANDCLFLQFDPDPSMAPEQGTIMAILTALDADAAQNPAGVANLQNTLQQPSFYYTDGTAWEAGTSDYARRMTTTGYVLECRIPLTVINILDPPNENRSLKIGEGKQFGLSLNQVDNDENWRDHQLQWSAGHADATWNNPRLHGTVTFLADNKLKLEAVNAINTDTVNDSAEAWYNPQSLANLNFTVDDTMGRVPLTVLFSDISKRSMTTWNWDFNNDGSTDSNEKNPSHTYFDADSFTVTLTASDAFFPNTRVKEKYIHAYFDTIPNLFQISDIPDDQGGWVDLQFARSAHDTTSAGMSDEYYIIEIEDGSGWRTADSIGATATSIYSLNIGTPLDSTSESTGVLDFRVTAYMNAGTFVSQTVSGYSVDNRRPGAPKNLSALLLENLTVSLTWNISNAPDCKQYTVYRSTDDFHFISVGTTTDTTLIDEDVELNQEYFYVVTAMDSSGNESDFSVSVTITVAVSSIGEDSGIPVDYYLAQNFPNPFNPTTTIKYGLPQPGDVQIIIYDILGHRVKDLIDERKSAGHHREQWDATNNTGERVSTGIYYYKIKSEHFTQIKKMILIR